MKDETQYQTSGISGLKKLVQYFWIQKTVKQMNHTDWYYIESRNVLGKCHINMQLWQVWVLAKILFHMKKHEKTPKKQQNKTNKQKKRTSEKKKIAKQKQL